MEDAAAFLERAVVATGLPSCTPGVEGRGKGMIETNNEYAVPVIEVSCSGV